MPDPRQSDTLITVRRATGPDAALLSELAARLFSDTYASANDPNDMREYLARNFTPETQDAELRDPSRSIWIAEAAGVPIGYAVLKRGTTADGIRAKQPAEVQRIYVDRKWHGAGVAARLLETCVEHALAWGSDAIWLGVWENNPRAIAFYRKHGFRDVGRQTFILGRDVQHDLVMLRALD